MDHLFPAVDKRFKKDVLVRIGSPLVMPGPPGQYI